MEGANTPKGIPFPPGLEAELKRAKSVNDIFSTLEKHPTHWNFTSIEILTKMAEVDTYLIKDINKYKEEISSVKLVDVKLPPVPYDDGFYTTIDVKIDVDPKPLTMKGLFELQSEIANILNICKQALLIVGITYGSLGITFLRKAFVMTPWAILGAERVRNREVKHIQLDYSRRNNDGEVNCKFSASYSTTRDTRVGPGTLC